MTGSNTISVASILSKYIPAVLQNNLVTLKLSSRPFEADFNMEPNGYNVGNTIRFRRPTYVNSRTGVVFQPQALTEREATITLNKPIGSDFNLPILQLTTDMDSQMQIMDRVIEPGIRKTANDIDKDVINGLMTSVYNVSGNAGATVGSWPVFDLAKTKLVQFGVPETYCGILNPKDRHYLQSSMVNFFNTSFNSEIGVKGTLGETSGIMCYESQNLNATHTNGSFAASGNVTIRVAAANGDSTLSLQGFTASTANVLLAGDIIRVASVYALNIMNQQAIGSSTDDLATFIVQSPVTSDASGFATVTVSPVITFSTGNPYNNVSALPAVNAVVTLVGGANATYTNNFIFSKDCIQFVMKPYFKPQGLPAGATSVVNDKKTGIAFNVTQGFDIINYQNPIRIDFLYGFIILPEYCVRLIG